MNIETINEFLKIPNPFSPYIKTTGFVDVMSHVLTDDKDSEEPVTCMT
jgi:hypothetical protein